MFIGREKELEHMSKLYTSNKFEFVVMYGRRRVGKTAIINKFTQGKQAIFFTGVETNEKQNLENFSKSILEFVTKKPANTSFDSFQTALEFVFDLSKEERIVLVIDEYRMVDKVTIDTILKKFLNYQMV